MQVPFQRASSFPERADALGSCASSITLANRQTSANYSATTAGNQDCPNNSRCKVCKKEGHSPGDEACEHYIEPSFKVVPFAEHPIPFFYPCKFKVFSTVHKIAEHAYQYVKTVRGVDIPKAQDIQSAH